MDTNLPYVARIAPHGNLFNWRGVGVANGQTFTKPDDKSDETSGWLPISAEDKVRLEKKRDGAGPSAPPMFEIMPLADWKAKMQEVRVRTRFGGLPPELVGDEDANAIRVRELERELTEVKNMSAASVESLTAKVNEMTGVMQRLLALQEGQAERHHAESTSNQEGFTASAAISGGAGAGGGSMGPSDQVMHQEPGTSAKPKASDKGADKSPTRVGQTGKAGGSAPGAPPAAPGAPPAADT